MKYAFKCANCGTLEPEGSAGELERPAACHVCGHGVRFDPVTGIKSLVPENWIVLADLDAEALGEYGLSKKDVERHTPEPPAATRPPETMERSAEENFGAAESTEGALGAEEKP